MRLSRFLPRFLGSMLILSMLLLWGCGTKEQSKEEGKDPDTSVTEKDKPEDKSKIQVMDFSQRLELKKPKEPVRNDPNIVFLGNSYTYVNDLPGTFGALAQSGGFDPGIAELSDGGYHLSYFADESDELGAQFYQIADEYELDYVIMQEQSRLPTMEDMREGEMYPAARTLDKMAKDAGAQTVFLMTWAYKNGDDLNEFGIDTVTTRDEMQTQLAQAYMGIADELGALLCPTGIAFVRCADESADIALWDPEDNMHPTPEGTYLTACTLYATLFNQSPVGLEYTAGLDAAVAATLQQVAADLVLSE